MTSNGPWSSRRSFQSGTRSTAAASTSSGASRTNTWRNPSRFNPRSDRRNCDRCCRITCGPKVRSSRPRFRCSHTFSGRLKTMPTGRQWNSLASWTSGFRASGCTFVASTTVKRPSASRFLAMKCSSSNAWLVTAWSFSSSPTIPRQASDDRISVGRKWRRANVLLPEPLGPIRTTRDNWGMVIDMIGMPSRSIRDRKWAARANVAETFAIHFPESSPVPSARPGEKASPLPQGVMACSISLAQSSGP